MRVPKEIMIMIVAKMLEAQDMEKVSVAANKKEIYRHIYAILDSPEAFQSEKDMLKECRSPRTGDNYWKMAKEEIRHEEMRRELERKQLAAFGSKADYYGDEY